MQDLIEQLKQKDHDLQHKEIEGLKDLQDQIATILEEIEKYKAIKT